MDNLLKGTEPNMLTLLVEHIEIEPYAVVNGGMVHSAVKVTLHRYNLDNVISQIIEDYGEEEFLKRIKALE